MAQYRKKPVIVDAEQFSYDGPQVRGVFYPSRSEDGKTYEGDAFVITMHDQRVYLQNGDWIIAEPDGEHFYPCKDDVFQATYEPVRVSSKSVFDLEPGEGWQPYMTINAEPDLEPETLAALEVMGDAVLSQFSAEPAEGAQAALEARDTMHVQLWERVMTLEQKLAAAISRAADAEKTEAAFSRLQSEHSDLIERENALESKLAAVPRYVFWCLNERERGRDVFPSLSEWLGEFAEPEKYPPFNAEDGLIDSIMQRGYAVWIRRMRRVPFGVILRRAGRYGAKTVTVYGAGETLPIALERALSKAERSQVPA